MKIVDLTGPVTVKNYDARMRHYGEKIKIWQDEWPFLSNRPGTPATADQAAWDEYFRNHLGGYPPTYRLFKAGKIGFLNMPEELPELFDISYTPPSR
jgi:hypothetical protein